jgi:hypothetical protein
MKKLILTVLAFLAIASAQAADLRTVLSASTTNGVTTTLYVGRVQGEPNADGTLTLAVFPLVVKTDSMGTVLVSELSTAESFSVALTPTQFTSVSALVKAAYDASAAAKAAAINPAP